MASGSNTINHVAKPPNSRNLKRLRVLGELTLTELLIATSHSMEFRYCSADSIIQLGIFFCHVTWLTGDNGRVLIVAARSALLVQKNPSR